MASDELLPCQRDPDRWFSTNRTDVGKAAHQCLSHCTRLVECSASRDWPRGGVLAGVRYVVSSKTDRPVPERRVLREIPCSACVSDPKPQRPPTDTGACGEPKGFYRHVARGQRACEPCTVAKLKYQRDKHRAWVLRQAVR